MPAPLLRYLAPWSASASTESRPPWNPLQYDSIGQFTPWRAFAAEQIRHGTIPLWNPYQFCGTPFVANSQSAVLYPGNLLYYLLPTARAAGWTAFLHLVLAGTFTWLFLRRLGASDAAGVLAGIAFAFSAWQVSWLELPTFLATSCWLPLVLLLTHRLFEAPRFTRTVALGLAIGLTLLAGHLQIAFYVLLAAGLLALSLAIARRSQQGGRFAIRALGLFGVAVVMGGMMAAPQVLPSLELSHRSHRNIPVSAQGYEAYRAYAVDPGALITLFLPDFYGNPSNPDSPYVGLSQGRIPFNYAEGSLYVGVPTLLLALFALLRAPRDRRALWLAGLALLSLLMALGTAIDALLYFYLPGFGQSGSPGRALVLWAFALAGLAALGWDGLNSGEDERTPRIAIASLVALILLAVAFYFLALSRGRTAVDPGLGLPPIPQLVRQVVLIALAGSIMILAARSRRRWAALLIGLVVADLFAAGIDYNLTASPAEVYPTTPLLAFLQQNAGHDRIMPVNHGWSLFAGGPRQATLPPNGAMFFGLHDVQGYDSLFPGQYKSFMNRLAGPGIDASPPEVGNMVFAKNPYSPLVQEAGVRFIVSPEPLTLPSAQERFIDNLYLYQLSAEPGRAFAVTEDSRVLPVEWKEDTPDRATIALNTPSPSVLILADQIYPGWHAALDGLSTPIERSDIFRRVRVPAGHHTVTFEYRPAAFRVGLYLMLAIAALAGFALAFRRAAPRNDATLDPQPSTLNPL